MIKVSRLNGKEFLLNCEMIKTIESTPDTIITLASGEKLMVREPVDEVLRRTVQYRQMLNQDPGAGIRTAPANDSVGAMRASPYPSQPPP